MRTERILILSLTAIMAMTHGGPASAGAITEFMDKVVSGVAKRFGRTAGAEAADQAAAGSAKRAVTEILYFKDPLAEATLGFFRDIKVRVTTGHYFPAQGRGKQIDDAVVALNTIGNKGLAIKGSEGTGKSHILIGLQERINAGNVPPSLKNGKVVEINAENAIMSDLQQVRGQFDKLLQQSKDDGPIILAFTNISYFLANQTKDKRLFDAFVDIAENKIGAERLRLVIEGTESELQLLGTMSRAARNLPQVEVKSLSTAQLGSVATKLVERLKEHHGFTMNAETIDTAVQWSERYLGYMGSAKSLHNLILGAKSQRELLISATESPLSAELREMVFNLEAELTKVSTLPGAYAKERASEIPLALAHIKEEIAKIDVRFNKLKAAVAEKNEIEAKLVKLKDEKGAAATIEPEVADRLKTLIAEINEITTDDLALWISRETHKPIEEILAKELSMADVEAKFDKNLFGQPELKRIGRLAAERAKARFRTGEGPVLSVLIIGKPGTGKTEFAKILGEIMNWLERWDMSEFMQAHTVARLIGAPPGYAGFDEAKGGELLKALQEHPVGNYLFDEIDLAHADFLKLMYQMLSDARATGGNGVTKSARDITVTMTTNLAMDVATPKMSREELEKLLVEASGGKFTKPWLNRVDVIVVANELDDTVLKLIIGKEIERLKAKMAKATMGINVTDQALDAILKDLKGKGLNPRDIQRVIRQQINDQVDRIVQQGFWRDAHGADVPLRAVEGDMIQVGNIGGDDLLFSVVRAPGEGTMAIPARAM